VHILCYRRDYLPAIWALKTFYHHTGVDIPLVIHINGDVPSYVNGHFARHFPKARLVSQSEADRVVPVLLGQRGLSRLAAARRHSPFMLKLTDFHLLANSVQVLAIDSDVLFFRRPTELLEAIQKASSGFLFQRDPATTYNLPLEQARRDL